MSLCYAAKHRTIDQFIDEHEIVLHRFLIHLAKVRLCDGDKAVTELEYESRVCIAPARGQPVRCEALNHGLGQK